MKNNRRGFMAQHTVILSYETKVSIQEEILHKDLELEIQIDGDKLGVIKISKGGFDWLPKYKQDKRSLTWKQFAAFMKEKFNDR
jgi:phage pi2 protein 07